MSTDTTPRWDLTPAFPSLESPEFTAEFAAVIEAVAQIKARFEHLGVRRREQPAVDAAFASQADEVIGNWNDLMIRLEIIFPYLHCIISTDARNEAATARLSELETATIELDSLDTRLVAWLGSSDLEALMEHSEIARAHEFWLHRAQVLASHQMTEAEENLASTLRPMGHGAWGKLHGNVTALLTADVELDGQTQTLPMSAIRALASHPDRAVRQRAFEAEIKAWPTVAVPLAAALNGVKGFSREVRVRRGWTSDLEPALLGNSIDAGTLAAMQGACVEAFPDFQRYMKAKARALNVEQLAWYDLIAPVGGEGEKWSWSACEESIETNFARYSDKMAAFARRSFEENWIDAEPRVGKQGGAYCSEFGAGDSRIMMNFDGSFTQVSTLAHELGHGYHNLCLKPRTPLQKQIPMTLAETASIFCETLVFEAAVEHAGKEEKIFLLDNALSRNLQVVVDIHSRFLFESRVFEKRAERELGETEFCDLMSQAQRDTYGDDLSPIHPYMWAVKGHYYGANFYNFPYTFGLLFALGLYARYRENPEEFRAKYDDFLSRSGLGDAATLANDFGFDTTKPDFWRGSLNIIREQIAEFEALVS
ncbi:M3 family oligoendopeptidase [bacterium]|nr:MAG: M3 family oligoendopeptidase [bacterium]